MLRIVSYVPSPLGSPNGITGRIVRAEKEYWGQSLQPLQWGMEPMLQDSGSRKTDLAEKLLQFP